MRKPQVVPSGPDGAPWVSFRAETDEQRMVFEGDDATPQLFEVRVDGSYVSPQHAHTEDEIIYVLSGSLRLGATTVEAGGSLFVPADTLYRVSAGPEGAHFLNFRPRAAGIVYKDEFMASRSRG